MTRRLDLIDDAVEGLLLRRLSMPEEADLFHSSGDLAELRRKATDLRDRRDALASLLVDGLLSPTAVREQAGRISRELQNIDSSIDAVEGLNPLAAFVGSVDVPAVWAALPLANKRRIIRSIVDIAVLPAGKGVRFNVNQLRITWKGAGA